jgi:hypothetical protein
MNSGIYNQNNVTDIGEVPVSQTQQIQPQGGGETIVQPTTDIKPNQMVQNQINPNAFGAPATINSVFGQANPGTFTRTVGPIAPPVPPTSITPTQNFENL